MSPPASAIDLGELPHGEQPEIAAGWPGMARIRRWRGRSGWRLAGAAAMTALVLAATGTAGAPPQSPLTLSFTVRASNYQVAYDADHVYLVEDTAGPEQTVVSAYRLADGAVQWQATVPGGLSWLTVWSGALLVVTYPTGPATDWPVDRTTRLDRDSGEPLWTQSGWPAAQLGDDDLLFNEPIVDPEAPDGYHLTRLSAVEVSTGDRAWSVEGRRWDLDAWNPPGRLVTLDEQGVLASYDLATGELMATAPTATISEHAEMASWGLRTIGSITLVTEEIDGEPVVAAYDVETLQRRWRLGAGVADAAGPVTAWPAACGDLLCLNTPTGVPQAIDPDTGATVWSAGWVRAEAGGGSYEVFDPAIEALAGHAILTRSPHVGNEASSWLIDVATGGPVLELRRWTIAGGFLPPPVSSSAGIVTRSGPDGTWIGRLRADLSGIDVLGRIESAAVTEHGFGAHCLPAGDYIVCLIETLTNGAPSQMDVSVWRLR